MKHAENTFSGQKGLEIFWQSWLPDGPPRATVVIAHGASEHSGRYEYLVEKLVPAGYAVYGIDHRGHGRSEGDRPVIDRMAYAVADLDVLIDLVRGEQPDVPLVLLGHSMGGCISLAYTLEHQAKLDGLILSSPAVTLEAASAFERVAGRVLSVIAPKVGVFGVDPDAISRDPAEVRRYTDDPLVTTTKLPARTVAELASAIDSFPARVHDLTLPLLIVHGDGDDLVPLTGTRMLEERAGSRDKTVRIFPGGYHELFNEEPSTRDEAIRFVIGWLDEHSAAPR